MTGRLRDDPAADIVKYIEKWDVEQASDLRSIPRDWHFGLLAAIMSTDRECQRSVGGAVYEALTAEAVQALDGRSTRPRIDMDVALGGFLAGRDVGPHLTALRSAVDRASRPEYYRPWGLPQADVIEAIQAGDTPAVEAALAELDEFHREHRASNEHYKIVRREVNFQATAYVALARQRGLRCTYQSEFVPEAVVDDDHYPVGER